MRTISFSLTSAAVGALTLGLMGCPAPAPVDMPDAATSPRDTPMGTALCSAVPSRNFGTDVGRNFEGFTLQQ